MLTFQQIIERLNAFWEKKGCTIHLGYDLETGAGTFNPVTFLRSLGPEPYQAAYVEPSRRPSDGRYGENPNRIQLFHQYQVLFKPSPPDIQQAYVDSLAALGLELKKHDIRFVHDDWESPSQGAHGLGWEVWLDGMEVSQFTYFQVVGSQPLFPITGEITYGLERLALYLQNVDSIFDIKWNETLTMRDIIHRNEQQWSHYNFQEASVDMWLSHFDDYEKEAKTLIEKGLVLPAYDFVIKASHAFNLLDARGAISVTERTGYIGRIRELSRLSAAAYVEEREKLGFPLLKKEEKKALPSLPPLPQKFDPKRKDTLLFEIGSEELPATFVPIGMSGLKRHLEKLFTKEKLPFDSIEVYGTPRRIAALVKGLAEGLPSETLEKKGPPVERAYDEKGELTKQGEGFFRSLGIAPHKETRTIGGTEYLFATVRKEGKSVYHILRDALPDLIQSIEFPKKMRWGSFDVHYARPLKSLVVLYGKTEIPFTLAGLVAGKTSYGHPQRKPGPFTIESAGQYVELLKKYDVLVDPLERRAKIEKELPENTIEKERVLDEVVHMVEWPEVATGRFDESFLTAPKEVLISEMIHHQRYFPLQGKKGALENAFILTADNALSDEIIKGNEKVLSARLADGAFLYAEDLKTPFEQFNDKLKKMTFQKELGTMLEKVERVKTWAKKLQEMTSYAEQETLNRAATLCKADLASELVGEFPELQGTIGKYYALQAGEKEEVALAIEEHWLPKAEKGALPQTKTGTLLSLADKIDNLCSYFGIGLKPTSSSDPFALRRQAIGLIKILLEKGISLDLQQIFPEEVLHFISQRARGVFEEYGLSKDEVEATLSLGLSDPFDQLAKMQALHAFRKKAGFTKLFEVYKRASGIIKDFKPLSFDPKLATEPAEKMLVKALEGPVDSPDYQVAFEALAALQEPLAHLFDTVRIQVEDPKIRDNRVALLQKVCAFFDGLANFSKIQEVDYVSHH